MKNIFHITLASLSITLCIHGAQDSDDFKCIKFQNNVKQFAGHVVVYKTDSYYLGSRSGYSINPDTSVKYGYIEPSMFEWNSGEIYNMQQLISPTEHRDFKTLKNSTLEKANLIMRLATKAELKRMREAVSKGRALFDCANKTHSAENYTEATVDCTHKEEDLAILSAQENK